MGSTARTASWSQASVARWGTDGCGSAPPPPAIQRSSWRMRRGRPGCSSVPSRASRCCNGHAPRPGAHSVPDRVPPAYAPDHYLNRELSWLEFNARVLEEAADPSNRLLERLKFVAIFSSNLDEFFEIRVAGLQQQVYAGVEPQDFGADGMAPAEQLAAIDRRVHELVAEQYRVLTEEIFPGLTAGGIERVRLEDLSDAEQR